MAKVGINLSEHFSLAELTKTNTKIKNVPNEAQVENLKRLCGWLEQLRRVNRAVGGVATSNHLTGCAVDIHVTGLEQLIHYASTLLDISDERQEDFDELLLERSPKGTYWLHFAVRPSGNRRKVRLIQT